MPGGDLMDHTGQFGVVRTGGTYSALIRAFQSLRYPPELSSYTHTFVAIDETRLIEAWPGGARVAPISNYTDILWSQFNLTETQKHDIVKFNRDHLGDEYAWEDIPLIGLALVTRKSTPTWVENILTNPHRWICSALVDASYKAAGRHLFWNVPPAAVFPAMLAKYCRDHGWTQHGPGKLKGWT